MCLGVCSGVWLACCCVGESVEQPGTENLQGPAEFIFAGQQEGQAASQKRENYPSGHTGPPFKRRWREREKKICGSVPARQFGHINDRPPVISEVKELDLTKKGSRDRRGRKPPRAWIATEFEAG